MLLLFHGAIVVHEDEGALVFGVLVALCTLIAGTEIALGMLQNSRWRNRRMLVHTDGSYSGNVVLLPASCCPLYARRKLAYRFV